VTLVGCRLKGLDKRFVKRIGDKNMRARKIESDGDFVQDSEYLNAVLERLMPREGDVVSLIRMDGQFVIVDPENLYTHKALFDQKIPDTAMLNTMPRKNYYIPKTTVFNILDIEDGWYQDSAGNLGYFDGKKFDTTDLDIRSIEKIG
jgi:hypothetical protein